MHDIAGPRDLIKLVSTPNFGDEKAPKVRTVSTQFKPKGTKNTEPQSAERDPRAMNQRALNRQKNEHKTLNRREHARSP
jgi:hypothetical protein